ncbi:STAS domain-containing protein [uncultured Pontibacter sp.]|uniref:STAS domain-containing protein n=1 Tax=uncultured Pontibacter sp. TaxID=453356 RepID=UPI0026177B2F|nr:STAS domain-containing protein [uncultured Pontibacter sp.]
MERFKATIDQLGNIVAVRLVGELDANTAVAADDALQEAIASTPGNAIVVDCSELQYISSAGLGVILSSLHACNQNKIKIAFCGLQPKIKNVFTILGIEKIILITQSEEEALKLLNNGQDTSEI